MVAIKGYFLEVSGEDAEVVSRIGAADCLLWEDIPQEVRERIATQAGFVEIPGSTPVQLRQIVDAFIASKKVSHDA